MEQKFENYAQIKTPCGAIKQYVVYISQCWQKLKGVAELSVSALLQNEKENNFNATQRS